MSKYELISSVVKLKKFAPVVDLQWAESLGSERDLNIIDSYIITDELTRHFENILEGFTLLRHEKKALRYGPILDPATYSRAHILRGQYGTGKSYFLLMASALLESFGNAKLYNELYNKFSMFDEIQFHMDDLAQQNVKYLVVRIDGVKNADMYFNELIQKRVVSKMQDVFGEIDFYDNYGMAIHKLEQYAEDPTFSGLLKDSLAKRAITYEFLMEGLKASKRKSIGMYREIIEAITKHKIKEGFDSLEEFLYSASSYVDSRGYSGIVILFDEFSAYISASIEEGRITTDLAAIQSLAQLTLPREGQNLFFLCAMHIDIGIVLGNIMETAEEIQKVRGRFSEMTLSFNNSANLVENILMVDKNRFQDLERKYREYFSALTNRYPNMSKVYPIHPHSVDSIITVSGKFAQNERTIFSFFAETVNKKLNEPVILDQRLNLITTGDIYNYFIDTIAELNVALKDSALRCLSFCKTETERDIIKALVIAYVSTKEGSDSRLSPRDISFILGLSDIKEIDTFLKEMSANPLSNIIFYEKDYRFEFIATGSTVADISVDLDKIALEIEPYSGFLELLEDYKAGVCIRKSYNITPSKDLFPIKRDLTGVIYRPRDLLRLIPQEVAGIDKDGKLLFAIPSFDDKIEQTFVEEVKIMMQKAPTNACVAIAKSFPYQLEKDLRLFIAAKNMERSNEVDKNQKKTLTKILQPLEKIIDFEIKSFGKVSNFSFVFSDGIIKESFVSLPELFSFMLKRHYSKFPKVNIENIRGKNSIQMLVENFFMFGEKINIPENYSQEIDRLIMEVLSPLDIVKVERIGSGFSARLKIPEINNNRESFEIWEIVNDTKRTVREIYELLNKAPYGLPDYMTDIYIAAAVGSNQLVITYKGQAMQLNKMTIALLNSSGYSLEKIRTATPELKANVKKIWGVFLKINGRCRVKKFEPEVSQNDKDTHSLIIEDMSDTKVILEELESKLENAGIENRTLLRLMKTLFELKTINNPVDYMEEFTRLPKNIFDMDNSSNAFECFNQFFEFLAKLNGALDSIRSININLSNMRNLESLEDDKGIIDLKAAYFEVVGDYNTLKKDISKDVLALESIKEVEGKLFKVISDYNEEFIKKHTLIKNKVGKMKEILNSASAKLIEAFEQISFRNIKKLSDIRSELQEIKTCGQKPFNMDNEPLNCSCTGFISGLAGLIDQLELVKHMESSVQKQINNIGENHVSRLLQLDEDISERRIILRDYLKSFSEKEMPSSQDSGDAEQTFQNWENLKKYLRLGFEVIKEDDSESVVRLVMDLAEPINRYLIESVPKKKEQDTKKEEKKRIGFRTLYTQIQSEIVNSGYKSVTIDDFACTMQRIIERIKKDFDEINIEE